MMYFRRNDVCLFTQLRQKAGLSSSKINSTLRGKELTIDLDIFLEHVESVFKLICNYFTVLDVDFFEERHTVRHYPCIALPSDGP